jgi:hypothetical protein
VNLQWSLASVAPDQSVVRGGILDVGHNLLDEAGGRGSGLIDGSSVSGSLGFHLLLDGIDLLLLLSKLLLVGRLLLPLGIGFFIQAVLFSDLLLVELMLALDGVGVLAGGKDASKEEDGEDEAAEGVPNESVGVDNAEGEDAPPVQSVDDPEDEEHDNDDRNIPPGVLVDALVVGLIDGVVAVTVSGSVGSIALLGSCFGKCRPHFFYSNLNKLIISLN